MIRKSLAAMALVAAAPLASAQSVSMCVFDVIGANGDFYNFVKDYALEMKGHGVDNAMPLPPRTFGFVHSTSSRAASALWERCPPTTT